MKKMKLRKAISAIFLLFAISVRADPPTPLPKLLKDKNYILYEVSGKGIVMGSEKEPDWCMDDIIGKKATLWTYDGHSYKVTIGGCNHNDREVINRIALPAALQKKKWVSGVVTIKPNNYEAYRPVKTPDRFRNVLIKHLSGKYPILTSTLTESDYGKEVVSINATYGPYVYYEVICASKDTDSDYGYYSVCEDSRNAGSYLFNTKTQHSVRINKGVSMIISWVFNAQGKVVVFGSFQGGKSYSSNAAFLIDGDNSKLIYTGFEEGS